MKYDTNLKKKQTPKHLARRGLDNPKINLTEIGIIDLVETHNVDTELYTVTDTGDVKIKDNVAHVIYNSAPKTGPGMRERMCNKVNQRRDQILAGGVDFTLDGAAHTLQTRGVEDLLNWTNLLDVAKALSQEELLELRTAANQTLTIPAGKVVSLISGGIVRRVEIMDASWRLKDDINDARDDAQALQVYEAGIDTVWPDDGPIVL